MTTHVIQTLRERDAVIGLIQNAKPPITVDIKKGRKRSLQANAYLWGVVYPAIIDQGGEQLAGWTKEDLHEYWLGEFFGWEMIEGFGRKRMKPIERSSNQTVTYFAWFVDYIIMTCASKFGIVIPEPDYREFEKTGQG